MNGKETIIGAAFIVIALLAMPAWLNAQVGSLPASGTVEGLVDRIESDMHGLFSVWLKVHGRIHEFVIGDARIKGGGKTSIEKGTMVRIEYRNLEHSEMDDSFTANAVTITVLEKKENDKAANKANE